MRWKPLSLLTIIALGLWACDQTSLQPVPDASEASLAELGTVVAGDNGATVVKGDWGCGVIDGLGNWFPEGYPDEALFCGTEVATNSKNLNAKITVRASGVPNPTGKLVRWGPYNPGHDWAASYPQLPGPPYPCFLLNVDRDFENPLYTVNWSAWVTPSGEATLVCHYKKQWDFQLPETG